MIANLITVSRIVFSLLLLVWPMAPDRFAIFYLLCGVSDVLDGFIARKLRTESEKGAMLDSAADLIFAVFYAVRVLPRLSLPRWLWLWTGGIAVVKLTFMLLVSHQKRKLFIRHSWLNKLTGLLVFLLPLMPEAKYGAVFACAAATLAAGEEIIGRAKENEQV